MIEREEGGEEEEEGLMLLKVYIPLNTGIFWRRRNISIRPPTLKSNVRVDSVQVSKGGCIHSQVFTILTLYLESKKFFKITNEQTFFKFNKNKIALTIKKFWTLLLVSIYFVQLDGCGKNILQKHIWPLYLTSMMRPSQFLCWWILN